MSCVANDRHVIEVQMTLPLTEPSCAWSVPTVLILHINEALCLLCRTNKNTNIMITFCKRNSTKNTRKCWNVFFCCWTE